jgi:hypothetical protein
MTGLTLRDKVVEALQAAGTTEEIVAAAVGAFGAFGAFGNAPPRPRRYADRALRRRADAFDCLNLAAAAKPLVAQGADATRREREICRRMGEGWKRLEACGRHLERGKVARARDPPSTSASGEPSTLQPAPGAAMEVTK